MAFTLEEEDFYAQIYRDFRAILPSLENTVDQSLNSLGDIAIRILREIILSESEDIRERIDLDDRISNFVESVADLSSGNITRLATSSLDNKDVIRTVEDILSTALIGAAGEMRDSASLSSSSFESAVDQLVTQVGRELQNALTVSNSEDAIAISSDVLSHAQDFYVQGVINGEFESGSEEARVQTRRYVQRLIFSGNSIEEAERELRSLISDRIRPALDELRSIPTFWEDFGLRLAEGYRWGGMTM